MMREMLQAKLHRACVTETRLEYPGSLTVDRDLLDRAGILVHQKVQVVNCMNGSRLETYVIEGERGKGEIIVNGAAARLAQTGDRIIIIAYASYDEAELAAGHTSRVVVCNADNSVAEVIE
ncbi:MAG: aspartate 1-decarboxylase [Planctomycetota bacterium]|jgi:aspartate 1-decarboxylase|nr:aspartate 1-decarboxylase [Planctomycetota bacterium]